MNAEKKRRQMCLLEESMHAIRTEFNERVLALRAFRMHQPPQPPGFRQI